MDAPNELETAADDRDDVVITRREYPDETVVAVDFGAAVPAALDVVDGTAIVVAGDRQFEFAVPEGATALRTNGGVLVIEAAGEEGAAEEGADDDEADDDEGSTDSG